MKQLHDDLIHIRKTRRIRETSSVAFKNQTMLTVVIPITECSSSDLSVTENILLSIKSKSENMIAGRVNRLSLLVYVMIIFSIDGFISSRLNKRNTGQFLSSSGYTLP